MELNFGLYLSEAAKPLLCDLDYSLKEMVHVVVLFIPNFIIVILGCNETGSIFLVDRSSPPPPTPLSLSLSLSITLSLYSLSCFLLLV